MNSWIIASKHPSFGKLYLGRRSPVSSRAAALSFGSEESARERIAFWQGLIEECQLDPRFFMNLYPEQR